MTEFGVDSRLSRRTIPPGVIDADALSEREYLLCFAARPGMYVGYTTWHAVTSFLTGYSEVAVRHGGQGLVGFREWLMTNHLGRESNYTWAGIITHIVLPDWDRHVPLTNDQQVRALEALFDLLDAFLNERETGSR